MAKELVKAGKHQEFRAGSLHLLDEGTGVAHVGHSVLNAHDVGMACGQLQHQIRAEVVAGALGEVVQQHRPLDPLGQGVVEVQNGAVRQAEVVGGNHHGPVGALLQGVVG